MGWHEFLMPSTPILELIARGGITYLMLVLLFRIVGRREAGGLGITDLLVVVLVADAAGAGMAGESNTVADGMVLTVTMLFLSVVLDAAAYRWPRFARVIKARPRPLVRDGRFNYRLMRNEFMSEEEALAQLRIHGISDPSLIKSAYLEPNGMVSIVPKTNMD